MILHRLLHRWTADWNLHQRYIDGDLVHCNVCNLLTVIPVGIVSYGK